MFNGGESLDAGALAASVIVSEDGVEVADNLVASVIHRPVASEWTGMSSSRTR
jgi:hypothetical protein